jgi:hypothetical protein
MVHRALYSPTKCYIAYNISTYSFINRCVLLLKVITFRYESEDSLGSNAVYSGRLIQTFLRNVLPPPPSNPQDGGRMLLRNVGTYLRSTSLQMSEGSYL